MNGTPNRSDNAVTVTVTVSELEQLRDRLGSFASMSNPDLSRWMVDVTDDGYVRWTATDAFRLGRLTAGTADGARTFGVPVRTFTLAWQMADRRDVGGVTFAVSGDGDGDGEDLGVLHVDGVEVPFDASLDGYPDVDEYLTRRGKAAGTAVTVAAEDLFAAIHGANLRPPWLDADQQESFVLHVDAKAGRLRALATWDGHADTTAAVACTAGGDTRVGVNPGFLFDLASAAGEDVLTLHLPPDPVSSVRPAATSAFTAAFASPVRCSAPTSSIAGRGARLFDADERLHRLDLVRLNCTPAGSLLLTYQLPPA